MFAIPLACAAQSGVRVLNDDDIIHFCQMSVDKPHAEEIQRRIDREK